MIEYVFEPSRIKERIRLYERRLVSRNLKVGSNTKYMIGPYYLMLENNMGALNHYEWFEKKFPDLTPEPYQGLCWILALIRVRQFKKALFRLKELHLTNVYLIPGLLELNTRQIKIVHLEKPWSTIEYLRAGPVFLLKLWRDEEKKWIKDTWFTPEFQDFVETQLLIDDFLSEEKDPEERKIAYLERGMLVRNRVSICPMRHLRIV